MFEERIIGFQYTDKSKTLKSLKRVRKHCLSDLKKQPVVLIIECYSWEIRIRIQFFVLAGKIYYRNKFTENRVFLKK